MTLKTKKILKAISNDARNPSKSRLHIIPSISKGWSVVPDHTDRAVRVFPTRHKAISFAKNYINEGEILIHNSAGIMDSTIIIK